MVRATSGSSMRNSCPCRGSPSDAAEVMSSARSVLKPFSTHGPGGHQILDGSACCFSGKRDLPKKQIYDISGDGVS